MSMLGRLAWARAGSQAMYVHRRVHEIYSRCPGLQAWFTQLPMCQRILLKISGLRS